MTTLRRALKAPFKGASIKALAALLCAALVFCVAQPALAAPHGGGGGGHSGGGGHGGAHGTAHPVGGGHYVGPYRGGFGGRGFGRGFGGRGFFPGRGFGFYGYPGFGFGLGLGLGFAWDYPWAWGPGYYGYWGGYPGGYGYDWPYYYGYQTPPVADDGGYNPGGDDGTASANPAPAPATPGRPAPRDGRDGRAAMGAINLDLSPTDAQVYLNGEYVGHVRDFGGWSHGYLWLEKGTYDIVFYKDGYKTLARQVTIYPGLIITWDDKMEHGQAIRPEDLPTKTHERRDARIQFESDRAAQIDAQQAAAAQEPPPYTPPADSGWRTRVDGDRNGNAQPQGYARPQPAPAPQQVAGDSVDTLSHLHLKIDPADASVYLDGRFVGTGSDLAANDEGLVVAPGRHKLAVVRPGRAAKERSFTATAGNDVNLTVALAAMQAAP